MFFWFTIYRIDRGNRLTIKSLGVIIVLNVNQEWIKEEYS